MKKKLIASVLCLSMAAASLAGCGGSDGNKAGHVPRGKEPEWTGI